MDDHWPKAAGLGSAMLLGEGCVSPTRERCSNMLLTCTNEQSSQVLLKQAFA